MNRHVLVTGCSSGIGLAAARLLAARDVHVYATVRNDADAERLAAIDGVVPLVCDVTDEAHIERMRATIEEHGTGLWGVINNAGVAHVGHLTNVPLQEMKDLFEINVYGVHRVTNAVMPMILASGGRIVNMSSISGTGSSAEMGVYSMSKHALEAYTDSLAIQLLEHGVHVCAVSPGNFESAITSNLVKRVALPEAASDRHRQMYEPGADTTRTNFPPPDAVAEACYAALFDDAPLRRYLVTPNAEEALWTLKTAALELARLNASSPYRLSRDELIALLDEATELAKPTPHRAD
jgi:NAD(P)-dependent dehydrogenase (short-subunit alcohol dehydrogenase family)